jgi:hypothetical protein
MTRRRLFRLVIITVAVFAAAALAVALAARVYGAIRLSRAQSRFEREVGPLTLLPFVKPRIPAEKNAATWLRAGAGATIFFGDDTAIVGTLAYKSFDQWTADETARFETILERSRPALTLLDRARPLRESNWEIPYLDGYDAKLPNLLAALNAAKLLAAQGRLAVGRGDRATALASVETLGALARSHENESLLIMLMVGLAIEKLEVELVRDILTTPAVAPGELDRLDAALCDRDLHAAMRLSVRQEAVSLAKSDGSELADPVLEWKDRWQVDLLREAIVASALDAHRISLADIERPVTVPLSDPDDSHEGFAQRAMHGFQPNLRSMSARTMATLSARELAQLALALRRATVAGAAYPPALPAVRGIAEADPLTGEARSYRVAADGSAELASTTTDAVLGSIFPARTGVYDALYVWRLPPPGARPLK